VGAARVGSFGVVSFGVVFCVRGCGAAGVGMISSFSLRYVCFLDGSTEKSKELMTAKLLLVILGAACVSSMSC
jgi:hypothetical protein